jgi:hypothetical protein
LEGSASEDQHGNVANENPWQFISRRRCVDGEIGLLLETTDAVSTVSTVSTVSHAWFALLPLLQSIFMAQQQSLHLEQDWVLTVPTARTANEI